MSEAVEKQLLPRVFISYSRVDQNFADGLDGALSEAGFTVLIDRHSIAPGEPWKERLAALIVKADAVVFVISPESVASPVCEWEAKEAERRARRVLPIAYRKVEGARIYSELSRLNWIDFQPLAGLVPSAGTDAAGSGTWDWAHDNRFKQPFATLVTALNTDLDWVRGQTRLGEAAVVWEQSKRRDDLLIRGQELSNAINLLATQPHNAPQPADLTREFITASRVEEAAALERQRRAQRLRTVLLSAVAGLVAVFLVSTLIRQYNTDLREAKIFTSLAGAAHRNNEHDRAMRYGLQATPPKGALFAIGKSSELDASLAGSAQASHLLRVLKGNAGVVDGVAFSPDGTRLATASFDGELGLFDTRSQAPGHFIKAHDEIVRSVAFSPDGASVLTSSDDGFAKLWSAGNGTAIVTLSGCGAPLHDATLSPDGRIAIAVANNGTACLWTLSDPTAAPRILQVHGHDAIMAVRFSPDGTRFVTGSDDKTARIWSVATLDRVQELKGHTDTVRAVAFNHDGTLVATASDDTSIRIFDAATGHLIRQLDGHQGWVRSIAFSTDGRILVSSSSDTTVRVWQTATGKALAILRGHERAVGQAVLGDGDRVIASVSDDHTARLWRTWTDEPLVDMTGHEGRLRSLAFSPNGRQVLTTSDDRTARLWDAATGRQIGLMRGHAGSVRAGVFNPAAAEVLTISDDKSVRFWSTAGGEGTLTEAGDPLILSAAGYALACSHDGRRFVTGAGDGTVVVWDAATRKPFAVLAKPDGKTVFSVSFSPDDRLVAIAGENFTVRLVDAASGVPHSNLKGHEQTVLSVAFSPDGRQVLTGSNDFTARLWDVATGRETKLIKGPERAVLAVGFSRDGRWIATGSADNAVRIWDAQSATQALILTGHDNLVRGVAFDLDGRRLATASWDGHARIFGLDWLAGRRDGALRDQICDQRLVGAAQEFTSSELDDPILRGISRPNPCLRRGPLTLDYWQRLPGDTVAMVDEWRRSAVQGLAEVRKTVTFPR